MTARAHPAPAPGGPPAGGPPAAPHDTALATHRRYLWQLCYRMTGVAADADDLVQETFLRAVEQAPPEREGLRPWLVRVAMNLARDHLRRRRRRAYIGPWLPSPAPADAADDPLETAVEPRTTEGRYDLLESVGYAFLLALEALTPQQRAVLLLRDVCDYSVRETAQAVGASEASVKVTHLRARRAMAAYDRTRRPHAAVADATRDALLRFMAALAAGDPAGIAGILSPDVRLTSDGAGEFHAARKVVVGRDLVTRFLAKLAARRAFSTRVDVVELNGLPALTIVFGASRAGDPPRGVIRVAPDADGRIAALHTVLATRKLTAVAFPA